VVTPATFDALGIPLLQGRDIDTSDDRGSNRVVVLSESLAAALFPDGSSLGRVVGVDVGSAEPDLYEVVGVVGDVIPSSVAEGSAFSMYFSWAQRSPTSMTLAVRSTGSAVDLVPALRGIIGDLDPDVPLSDVRTMDEVLDLSVSGQRAIAVLLAGFGAMALILAAVGLYGVLAFQVSRRRHEIGVRMALGASSSSVSRDVLTNGVRLVAVGLLFGIPGAFAASRLVRGMLYVVSEGDPLTYVAVVAFLVVVAGAACMVPAHRAARVDPVRAFHSG
jgi:putative ABC transport system permease protein